MLNGGCVRIEAFKDVRDLTRLSLPENDKYIYQLGVALYGFASLCSFFAEITELLNPSENRTLLEAEVAGTILNKFEKSIERIEFKNESLREICVEVGLMFKKLNEERTDFVHAYPTGNSEQRILHRRLDRKSKDFEVTSDFLNGFISQLHDASTKLYKIRDFINSGGF